MFLYYLTDSYIKHNFKLKIDSKMFTFKHLEEILKTWKKFGKSKWQFCKFLEQLILVIYTLRLYNLGIIYS